MSRFDHRFSIAKNDDYPSSTTQRYCSKCNHSPSADSIRPPYLDPGTHLNFEDEMATTINLNKPTISDRTDSLLASAKSRTKPHGHSRPLLAAGNCFLQGGKSASRGVNLETKDLHPAETATSSTRPRVVLVGLQLSRLLSADSSWQANCN